MCHFIAAVFSLHVYCSYRMPVIKLTSRAEFEKPNGSDLITNRQPLVLPYVYDLSMRSDGMRSKRQYLYCGTRLVAPITM